MQQTICRLIFKNLFFIHRKAAEDAKKFIFVFRPLNGKQKTLNLSVLCGSAVRYKFFPP
jgi:hypothetical protein